MLDRFECTAGRLHDITTDNTVFKFFDDTRAAINTRALDNPVGCFDDPQTMHGASHPAGFRCIPEWSRCKGRTKSLESGERDQQFGDNQSIDIGESQKLRKEGNARINKVSAM